MSDTPDQTSGQEPQLDDFEQVLASLPNGELLTALDLVLLELERRLLRYARTGHELLEMADEGLVLAVRAGARLGQAQSSAVHTAGHLQVVGVGEWSPTSTQPGWSDDPRATGEGEEPL
jgi:exonuclease VII small subunit